MSQLLPNCLVAALTCAVAGSLACAQGAPPGPSGKSRAAVSPPAGAGSTARLKDPEVWMCHRDPFALLEAEANWDFVRSHVSGIKLYIDVLRRAPAKKLAGLAKLLRDSRIQVAVECGGTLGFAPLDETNGEKSAEIELGKLERWYSAGGKVDFLDLDGPVRRLLYPGKGKKAFASVERCAGELMDYLRAVRKAHPELRFFLLANFPNWGYRGDVSYHARGPKRQDYGDYDEVVRAVLKAAAAAKIEFAGVTVDNPYEYAVGERASVNLTEPAKVNWLARIRAYEDFARSQGLEFNLIVNSEQGGKTSDRDFCERTLKMVEAYVEVGGRPTRYIVQSWYDFPKQVVPETAPHSMTALVKAVMAKLHPETGGSTGAEAGK